MPRIIFGADAPPVPTEELVRDLAAELTSASGRPLPLIIERHIRGTRSRHVWVIWDRWAEVDPEERTEIIGRAYAEAEGADASEALSIASGVLPQQAAPLGLVPYFVWPSDPPLKQRPDYPEALAHEAANTILGVEAKELRYPTEAEARQAVERLRRFNPEIPWVIHQDQDLDLD